MSTISELEGRISAAMDRIARGIETAGFAAKPADHPAPEPMNDTAQPVDATEQSGIDPAEFEAIKQALEDEKIVTAQLEERLRKVKLKHEVEVEDLKSEIDNAREAMARLDGDVQMLRAANAALDANIALLRQANESGVGEPELINKAMQSELEALRAARKVEASEAGAIVATLAPLIKSAQEGE